MVEENIGRQALELHYDDTLVQGDTIHVTATNPDSGDVSTRDHLKNDGLFTWTWPEGYEGNTDFVVVGSDGGEDTGTVHVDFTG